MKNYTSKPIHIKPQTHNAFKKSDRSYPQPTSIKDNQPVNMKMSQQPPITVHHYKTQPIITHTSQTSQRYHFLRKQPFAMYERNSESFYIDDKCLWSHNLDKSFNNSKQYIKFNKNEYILSDWAQDKFPSVIYICLDGFPGLFDENSSQTDRVAPLRIVQMNPLDRNGLVTYDLRYVLQQSRVWQIPHQLTQLKITIKMDNDLEPTSLPLPNQMVIDFQIFQK